MDDGRNQRRNRGSTQGRTVTPIAYSQKLPDEKDRVFLEAALALFDDGAVLVTGNKRHFPAADFVLSPSEFIALIAPPM